MLQLLIRFSLVAWLAMLAIPSSAQLIVAHRGASHDAPENTLAAFELAWEQGSDGVEGDFYLTADREIVCIHDRSTERTTGVDLPVESSTLAELRKLDAGSWKHARFSDQRIPTFDEVLQTVPPGRWFVIELKSKSQIVPVLAEQLRERERDDIRLLIISFDEATVKACKQQMPDVPAHWLTKFERRTPFSSYHPSARAVAQTIARCGADGVGFKSMVDVVDKRFIETLRQQGCNEYHVWTVDAVEDARYFQQLGVFGITTNRPAVIGRAIAISDQRPVR